MAVVQNYLPGDSLLIDKIVCELKSQGIFDEFRKECIADVDTKPAYQNLRQRVEGSVSGFLNKQTWNPDVNKNHVRELLRKNIYESGFLEIGVERIVDQVVNPKINSVFLPKVTEVVYKFLGIERPNSDKCKPDDAKVKTLNANSLLPTDLEAVSPESETVEKKHDKSNDSQNLDDSKIDEDESPPFEPIEEQTTYLPNEENSVDSHLSGLLSHDSNQSQDINKPMQVETSNQDSIISKHSSDGHLSIAMSDDADMKMEFCEDSHQSKSSKTNDSNSKTFDFNLENSSRSSSSKAERKSDHKTEDKSKADKSKSYEKHKSKSDSKSKDRKDERDRKSDHDKKDGKEKYSSKSRGDKSKDYKSSSRSSSKVDKERESKSEKDGGKSDKDRDSKTDKNEKEKSKSCNGSHHRSSSSSSSSKDKSSSRKESTSKESSSGGSKDKSKTSSSRGHKDYSKSKEDKDKSHTTKHDSKIDKNKKDDKHDRHHSRSDKHSSSSSKSKEKDKKEPKKEKKENKDDHFSSKKRSDRRSTDRDSNDGQSGLKSSSSSFDSYFSSSQTQSKNQESSNSNSNTGSGDSGTSDAVESEIVNLKTPITFVNDDIESVGEVYINAVPRIKLIKPKFASNIHEARRLMKIRRQLSKIEQQNVLQFSSKTLNNKEACLVKTEIANEKDLVIHNNWKNDRKPNILKKEESPKKHNVILDAPLQIEIPNHGSVIAEEEISQVSPPLKSSVVSAASWDALEAKFNQNIDYSTYYDDPDTPEKTNESIINVNTNPNDCFYFNEDDILPVTERYILFIMTLIEKLEKEIASSRQEEDDTKTNQNNIHHTSPETNRENGLNKSFSRKTFKRKLMEYSDAKNNNKKFNNHHIEVHESFSLPLSPAESDISVDKKSDIVESERPPPKKNEVELSVKFKKNNNITSAKRQRYSSEDLYKPRPFFSGSRRRARNNLELD